MKIKTVSRVNPLAPEEAPKYYASVIHDTRVELDELTTMVTGRCSVRRADVHSVLVALLDTIPAQLLEGNIVALGKLGSFYATVNSEGIANEEDCSAEMIRGANIRYRPTKEFRKQLRMLEYTFAS